MKNGSRALKGLHDGVLDFLEEKGAEVRNQRKMAGPPNGYWIYLEFKGRRYRLALESLDDFHAA